MKIYQATDQEFKQYGRIIQGLDVKELLAAMLNTPLPSDVVYEPSVKELEELPIYEQLQKVTYGEMPIQIGYCNGNNYKLNAVEYHRSSEINVAVTDMILLLGRQQDITEEFTYDTSLIKAFLIPKGTAVEVYATTLHYAPCNVEETGFRAVVVLPRGTNFPLDESHVGGENALITAKNKWLIGHEEGGLPEGSHIGLIGENVSVK